MGTSTVADDAPALADGLLQTIPRELLRESAWNPRQHFDPVKLHELAKSLREQGQLAPLVVRPRTYGNTRTGIVQGFEIGAGHRRYRAAQEAGLTHLLAVVREMDDTRFLELLVFENGNRHDLHPLEEAQGYKLLMEHATGYDIAKIAARDGRSTRYVYDSLKLLQLAPVAQKLFWAGKIERGHAIELSRLSAKDQRRVIGDLKDGYSDGGLFQDERTEAPAYDDEDWADTFKPVTVRELKAFINDRVRFRPDQVDLPNLFPETHDLLTAAAATEEKVVSITHEFVIADEARDGKTIGPRSWERADGQHKSKKCAHSVIGVVAIGPERGAAFRVCIHKDKCKVHWPEHVKRAAQRKKRAQAGPAKDGKAAEQAKAREAREEAQRQAREQANETERLRWVRALPALAKALAAKVKAAPTGASSALGQLVLERASDAYGTSKAIRDLVAPGRTADDLVRYVAWMELAGWLNAWRLDDPETRARRAKAWAAWGVDAEAIVDQVSPKPDPKQAPTKPAKKARAK